MIMMGITLRVPREKFQPFSLLLCQVVPSYERRSQKDCLCEWFVQVQTLPLNPTYLR